MSERSGDYSEMRNLLRICLILVLPGCSFAQGGLSAAAPSNLPSAPAPQAPTKSAAATATGVGAQATVPQNPPGTPTPLSLKDAQALALKNNPQISVARLTALASLQVTREVRSSLWPTARD